MKNFYRIANDTIEEMEFDLDKHYFTTDGQKFVEIPEDFAQKAMLHPNVFDVMDMRALV